MCSCQFLLFCLSVSVLCIEVLLCWVHRYLLLYVFLLDWALDHYVLSFFTSCNLLYLKASFVWYEDCYSSFLFLPICMEYTFPSSQCVCVIGLKWVSYRQRIYGSCFCIPSASLCLLVRAFSPFRFKVSIDIYIPIAIFLIVWGWFCRSFFFSCISGLYKSLFMRDRLVIHFHMHRSMKQKLPTEHRNCLNCFNCLFKIDCAHSSALAFFFFNICLLYSSSYAEHFL